VGNIVDELRGLVLGDDGELAFICAEVLAVLSLDEPGAEVLEFNVVDVSVDRNERTVTFQGVLSINDDTLTMSAERFTEVAEPIAEARSAAQVAEWRERRQRRIWPMPPAAE